MYLLIFIVFLPEYFILPYQQKCGFLLFLLKRYVNCSGDFSMGSIGQKYLKYSDTNSIVKNNIF